MSKEMIEVHQLSKEYVVTNRESGLLSAIKTIFKPKTKLVKAVDNLDFTIPKGEAVGFIGKNGAGKTTTIKMLTGTLFPTSGFSRVNGFDPTKRQKEFKKSISVVMGNRSQLFNDLTPKDYLNFLQSVYEIDENIFNNTVQKLTKLLNVENKLDEQTRKLSLGERMKIEFLAAVSTQPKVLFLDEPTIGLDVLAKRDIRKFLVNLNKKSQITIFLTSHDMKDIATICDRLIIVEQGKIIWNGKTDDLLAKFAKYKYITFAKSDYFQLKNIQEQVIDQDESSITIKVAASDVDQVMSELTKHNQGSDYSIHNLKLDDVILEIFSAR